MAFVSGSLPKELEEVGNNGADYTFTMWFKVPLGQNTFFHSGYTRPRGTTPQPKGTVLPIQQTFFIKGEIFREGRITPRMVFYDITTIVGANW